MFRRLRKWSGGGRCVAQRRGAHPRLLHRTAPRWLRVAAYHRCRRARRPLTQRLSPGAPGSLQSRRMPHPSLGAHSPHRARLRTSGMRTEVRFLLAKLVHSCRYGKEQDLGFGVHSCMYVAPLVILPLLTDLFHNRSCGEVWRVHA